MRIFSARPEERDAVSRVHLQAFGTPLEPGLVADGLTACRQRGCYAVVVLGQPDWCPRIGFEPSANYGIQSEYGRPSEVFMVMQLRAGALQGVRGIVRYRPVFAEPHTLVRPGRDYWQCFFTISLESWYS